MSSFRIVQDYNLKQYLINGHTVKLKQEIICQSDQGQNNKQLVRAHCTELFLEYAFPFSYVEAFAIQCTVKLSWMEKKECFFFNFLKISHLLKEIKIYQILKISFCYLFYFMRYKAESRMEEARLMTHYVNFLSPN